MSQIASAIPTIGLSLGIETGWPDRPADAAVRQLRHEYLVQQALFEAQPPETRQFIQAQAAQLGEALTRQRQAIQFLLPEQVILASSSPQPHQAVAVPVEFRQQSIGGWLARLTAHDGRTALRQRLSQLEQAWHPAVQASARLMRYATVRYLVHDLLPLGQPVNYQIVADEVVPTASTDPAAEAKFYMPEWVAFEGERLVAGSVEEAETRLAHMQRYLSTLHLAVSLAPYIFADEDYTRKRCGMLIQLINQGRALARYWTQTIIGKLQCKAQAHELDRGLSLSLPYFDDQNLEMRMWDFEVVPAGRTLFVRAFVVLAARREQARLAQDTRLSHSTRIHLISELVTLERAFDSV